VRAFSDLVDYYKERRGLGSAALALLPLLISTSAACGFTRGVSDVKAMSPPSAKFVIEAPCSVESAQGAVRAAGQGMELDVEEASEKPGEPWVLRRGARLNDGPLLYRVDVSAPADRQGVAVIRVYSVPVSLGVTDTHETLSKPGALAMRIVAACAAGGGR
jgi:hypothetical protein